MDFDFFNYSIGYFVGSLTTAFTIFCVLIIRLKKEGK